MTAALQEICKARVGQMLKGKWRLERILGIGGMAAVYEGVHHIGRKDAIKILHPDVARQPDLKRRFEVEASATNRFKHRGAVEIRDFDVSEDGCPFLVMEMLQGESLGERVRRTGTITEAEVMRFVDQLLDVLAAAHREGIVHRDIKLDNIFITSEERVKVLDFGVARILSGPVMTMAGTRLGTPAYMPPEQLRGLEVDARADIYAVGATMFRLLTKRRIHEAKSEADLIIKMSTEPAPKVRSVEPSVSPSLALVVDRALEFLASRRYQSAIVMQEDVRALMAGGAPAHASAEVDSASATSSGDRPTNVPGAGFGNDPTAATSAGRAVPPIDARAAIAATYGAGPISAAPTRAAPASIAATVAAPATMPTSVAHAGPMSTPTVAQPAAARTPATGREAIAATMLAGAVPSLPDPSVSQAAAISIPVMNAPIAGAQPAMPSMRSGQASAPSNATGARRAIAATVPIGSTDDSPPARAVTAQPPSRRRNGALVPILVVTALTIVLALVGLALYLHASAEEVPAGAPSASASAGPSGGARDSTSGASTSGATNNPPPNDDAAGSAGGPSSTSTNRSIPRIDLPPPGTAQPPGAQPPPPGAQPPSPGAQPAGPPGHGPKKKPPHK